MNESTESLERSDSKGWFDHEHDAKSLLRLSVNNVTFLFSHIAIIWFQESCTHVIWTTLGAFVPFLMPDSFIVIAWEEHDVVTAVTWNLYASERFIDQLRNNNDDFIWLAFKCLIVFIEFSSCFYSHYLRVHLYRCKGARTERAALIFTSHTHSDRSWERSFTLVSWFIALCSAVEVWFGSDTRSCQTVSH